MTTPYPRRARRTGRRHRAGGMPFRRDIGFPPVSAKWNAEWCPAVGTSVNTTTERLNPVEVGQLAIARPLIKVKLLFLAASFVSLLLSVSLYFGGHEQQGIFVGLWVPSVLSLGALLLAGENGEAR
jgi:hypothetical protein